MSKALDYSAGPIPGSVLKARGYMDVIRYLGPSNWQKSLTSAEVHDLWSNGINIHLNYETTANFMLGGYSAGISSAAYARSIATGLGFGHDNPIYYSDDISNNGSQVPIILDFLLGSEYQEKSRSVVAVYGQFDVVKSAINRGYSGWQIMNDWSKDTNGNMQRDARAFAYQEGGQITLNGIQCDLNTLNPNYVRTTVPKIPPSIAARWPQLTTEFPPGTDYDTDTAIIWGDAASRYTAEQIDKILQILQTNTPTPISLPTGTSLSDADLDRIAHRVIKWLGTDLGTAESGV